MLTLNYEVYSTASVISCIFEMFHRPEFFDLVIIHFAGIDFCDMIIKRLDFVLQQIPCLHHLFQLGIDLQSADPSESVFAHARTLSFDCANVANSISDSIDKPALRKLFARKIQLRSRFA